MKKIGMSFGFAAVQSGVRNANVEPQFVVVSTEGMFRITPQVSKALGLQHGDNVMFMSNATAVQDAIDAKNAELVAAVEEAGLEWGTAAANSYIHSECDEWAIAKGCLEFDSKGIAKTCKERLTAKDKVRYATQNFDALMEGLMASDNEEVKEAVSRDGITREEQIDILAEFVESKELPKYRGCKASNTSGLTGIGVSLSFTDNNVWKQMKSDLDEPTAVNRVYKIDLDKAQNVEVFDGYKTVTVVALPLGEYEDVAVSRNGNNE